MSSSPVLVTFFPGSMSSSYCRRKKRQEERLARENELNDLRISQMKDLAVIQEVPEFQ
jgi:hypothetical protein